MWPGEQQPGGQSGGQQYPQGNSPQQPQGPYGQQPNPYAQPGYPQSGAQPPAQPPGPPGPPPVQQPGPPQQNPYAQPYPTPSPYGQPGYGAPQSFGPPLPGGPEGGRPPGRKKATIGIAIGAALAVIAAVVVTVVLVGGDDKKPDAHGSTTPTPTATVSASPTPTPTEAPTATSGTSGGDDGDNPRGPAGSTDVTAVIPGWQPVKRAERNSVFDVPPGWTLDSEGMTIGYTDEKDKLQVAAGAPAYYMEKACTNGKDTVANATAATKGGSGAASLKSAAENEARAWAKWAFQENGKGTVSAAKNSKAFHNAHGITGWQAQATMTDVPKANKCSSNGIAYTVAWLDPAKAEPTVVIWVLWARQGVPDQLAQSVVDKVKSSIRPFKTS